MAWSPGTTIVLQEVWHGRIWSARPAIVAEDTGERLALWGPRGTLWKAPTTPPTRQRAPTRGQRFDSMLTLGDWVFRDADYKIPCLILVRPGDWHEVRVFWDEAGNTLGWYINSQRPIARTSRTIETMDLMLDLVVKPGRRWLWKDEDEFESLIAAGHIQSYEVEAVRRGAREVIAQIEANTPPFNEPWHDWRPDSAWAVPHLPRGWNGRETPSEP